MADTTTPKSRIHVTLEDTIINTLERIGNGDKSKAIDLIVRDYVETRYNRDPHNEEYKTWKKLMAHEMGTEIDFVEDYFAHNEIPKNLINSWNAAKKMHDTDIIMKIFSKVKSHIESVDIDDIEL